MAVIALRGRTREVHSIQEHTGHLVGRRRRAGRRGEFGTVRHLAGSKALPARQGPPGGNSSREAGNPVEEALGVTIQVLGILIGRHGTLDPDLMP